MAHNQSRLIETPQRAVTRPSDSAEETLVGRTSSSDTAAQTENGSVEKEVSRGSMGHHPLFADKARGIRLRALRFTASWYSVTMGTGIINTLLFDLPWENAHPTFRAIGSAFLIFDMALFLTFSILTITRYTLYPKIFVAMLQHETHSLFLGCIPMGFVTIISGIAATGHEYGLPTLDAALVLYWISVGMSMLTAFGIPFVMFTQHKHTSETLTAAWLLPIVPLITEAAVGSTLCKLLLAQNRHTYCLTLLIASYLCAGIGMLLAATVIVLYLQRLLLHHLPPREVIVSSWLPVGPIGQGGFALIELGQVATKLFPLIASPSRPALDFLGPAMLGSAVLTGLLLWGLGIWFAFLAIVSIAAQFTRTGTEGAGTAIFNMGWWAFTFPLGSLTLLTFSLATVFDSMFFKVCSTIMTFSVFSLWCLVFVPTCIGFFRGTLFAAPCLQALPKEYVEKLAPAEGGPRLRQEEKQAQAGA